MQTKITKISKNKPEMVEIHCHEVSNEVSEIMPLSNQDKDSSPLPLMTDSMRYL